MEKLSGNFGTTEALSLNSFREMDNLVVEEYGLPIELMMENAGLQLARLVVKSIKDQNCKVLIGVGNGNNGGGGLVAARRLAAWGFDVYLDMPILIDKELPKRQLQRALLFGAKNKPISNPHIWVDAYLGFSQRFPLSKEFNNALERANASKAHRISLDIPMGISKDITNPMFMAHQVLTLAAPKFILNNLAKKVEIYIADLGIPISVYQKFNIAMPPFFKR